MLLVHTIFLKIFSCLLTTLLIQIRCLNISQGALESLSFKGEKFSWKLLEIITVYNFFVTIVNKENLILAGARAAKYLYTVPFLVYAELCSAKSSFLNWSFKIFGTTSIKLSHLVIDFLTYVSFVTESNMEAGSIRDIGHLNFNNLEFIKLTHWSCLSISFLRLE